MASLTAHLRQPEEHGRLAFHPECPLCRRERLMGTLPAEGLVTRRTQAALVAGVLAASAAPPAAAFAQDADGPGDEPAVPVQVRGDDPTKSADFDPGGQAADLPFDAPAAPQAKPAPAPDGNHSGPLEEEPGADVAAPIADAGDEPEQAPEEEPAPSGPPTQPAPLQPAASAPEENAQPNAPTADALPTTSAPKTHGRPGTARQRRPDHARHTRDRRARADRPVATAHPPAAEQPSIASTEQSSSERVQVQVEVQDAPAPTARAQIENGTRRGERFHVVQPGESLWSIARDLLGRDASAAAVAREVNKLWERNASRIGTGDRDLLIAGTKLVLP
jgi:hypothetical protein